MNNIKLSEKALEIINHEYGYDESDALDYAVDTRDTFNDFKQSAAEVSGTWNDSDYREARSMKKNGLRYFKGTIQVKRGAPREDFLFIENVDNGFNVVVQ